MTSISQKIPRYILGMSDQPDELKVPGQVRDALNVLPDVSLGLLKRPGTKFINQLTSTSTGTWFHIQKNNPFTDLEKYIGQITFDGKVRIWDADTGKQMNVCYTNDFLQIQDENRSVVGYDSSSYNKSCGANDKEDYFVHETNNDLGILTVNDYTFVTNRKVAPTMSDSRIEDRPYEAFIELKALSFNQNYILDFSDPGDNAVPETVEYTSASKLSVAPVDWSLNTSVSSGSCARAFFDSRSDYSSGNGSGLAFNVISSCTAVPDGKGYYNENYSLTIELLNGGQDWKVGDRFTYTAGGFNNIRVTVTEITTTTVTAVNPNRAQYAFTNSSTPMDAALVLSNLKADILAFNEGFSVEEIGNGLYITRSTPFNLNCPDPTLMTVVSTSKDGVTYRRNGSGVLTEEELRITSVNTVGQLPLQCKHNYIVKVRNSFEQEDDYYVQFKANNNNSGPGVWEECAKPGIPHSFNPATMPHCILKTSDSIYDSDGDIIATFIVGQNAWDARLAGDELTNPRPSFAPQPGSMYGRPIKNILFFRDRLVFLSDENVIMSRTGDYFNLFGKSAVTVAADDPIDVAVSSTIPALLHDGLVVGAGLVVVSPNQQFLIRTDNDLLSPLTIKVSNIGSYSFNANTRPIPLGTNVGFFSDTGLYSRFYEMVDITVDRDPEVVEQSKSAGSLLPQNLELIANSIENDLIFACERESNEIWCYKYFNTGEKRALSSWFRWNMLGEVLYHTIIKDSYYVVLKDENGNVQLVRADIRPLRETTTLTDENFRIHFDFYGSIAAADMTYSESTNATTFTLPIPSYPNEDLKAFSLGVEAGRIGDITINGNSGSLIGDWTDSNIALGYTFNMLVEFPTIYPITKNGFSGTIQADTRGSLTLSRIKISLGDSGYYEAKLKSFGREDRIITYESATLGTYQADRIAIRSVASRTIPVYDKNTNFILELSSKHPSPTTLYSMEWEGTYSNLYYRSV